VDAAAAEPQPALAAPEVEVPATAEAVEPVTGGEKPPEEFIEVWRQGRPEGARRHRRPPRARPRLPARPEGADSATPQAPVAAELAAPGEAPATAAEPADGARRDRRPRRHRGARPDSRSEEHPQRKGFEERRQERGPRPEREGSGERQGRGERAPRGDRPDRDPELRAKYFKGRGDNRDRHDKAPDPNSPFAKLAALKEQLEANAKERR
jgi:ATP-dependent RNA helicase SUPV3L1/SUV3